MSQLRNIFRLLLIPILLLSSVNPAFSPITYASVFKDVNEGNAHFMAVNYLKENQIIDGYDDGTFKPFQEVNRAEALKMLTLASGLISEDQLSAEIDEAPFPDTPTDAWYTKYLIPAKERGIIAGYDDGNFQPYKNVNLAESLKMYFESFDNIYYPNPEDYLFDDTPLDAWYTTYTSLAASRGMLYVNNNNTVDANQKMTRGYLADLIYKNILSQQGKVFGKATYYGAAVQGNFTASGEIFDYNLMTAAHKTLPFGTMVKVTNLANGKSVEVKINDRGPYGPGRIIDLSSAAFEKIFPLSRGVAHVKYEIISLPQ